LFAGSSYEVLFDARQTRPEKIAVAFNWRSPQGM
jgi:hypothetical protein